MADNLPAAYELVIGRIGEESWLNLPYGERSEVLHAQVRALDVHDTLIAYMEKQFSFPRVE
jgi:hypothetical protein